MTWLVIHARSRRFRGVRWRLAVRLLAFGILPALVVCSRPRSARPPADGPDTRLVGGRIDALPASNTQTLQWVTVTVPDGGKLRAAVARPADTGRFPALILLHGTHGFAQQYVSLAQDLSRHGVLAVAACWFSGGSGPGTRFVTPIECPEAPPMPAAASPAAMRAVDALVAAVRTFPGVRSTQIALFGHSRGGGAALHYVLGGGTVVAAVLNSAGYPPELASRVGDVNLPILILHGTADGSEDGGSALTRVEMARAFETSLRRAGKTVEAKYYQGGHNSLFTDRAQHNDEVQQIIAFLTRHRVD